ncbi:MAG: HAD family hydrolase [Chloroflexi bacterium]|nr:HAD family hydrolase [Chloroflexota bacterium]
MMIKAVFFDLYHTLVGFDPPRERQYADALKAIGRDVPPETLRRPLLAADEFINQEMARRPLGQRPEAERTAVFARYARIVLTEVGIELPDTTLKGLLGQVMKVRPRLVPFEDVVPALETLGERGLILGLISNVDRDGAAILEDTGLLPYLKVVVTSHEVGFSKPQPEIYREALRCGRVEPAEALYIGDQYRIDIVGANNAGMKGVLLDRYGLAEAGYAPVIRSLSETAGLL